MTGSLAYNRQHSSTAGHSNVDKMEQQKLRRWSSADHPYLFDVITEEKPCFQRNQTPSDFDSGVEDIDQQTGNDDEIIHAFAPCSDDDVEEGPIPPVVVEKQPMVQKHPLSLTDLARLVPDVEKKEFCENTMIVFHGEFARLIYEPMTSINENFRYHLFAQEELISDACKWPGFDVVKLDNAKTQFQCTNPSCRRLWTSARGRIAFIISRPQPYGFIVLKIFEQQCGNCYSLAEPLWYTEEVCRVMKNLANFIFARYFPSMVTDENAVQVNRPVRRPQHDPQQRQGKMKAVHNKDLCVACRFGFCFM